MHRYEWHVFGFYWYVIYIYIFVNKLELVYVAFIPMARLDLKGKAKKSITYIDRQGGKRINTKHWQILNFNNGIDYVLTVEESWTKTFELMPLFSFYLLAFVFLLFCSNNNEERGRVNNFKVCRALDDACVVCNEMKPSEAKFCSKKCGNQHSNLGYGQK